MNNIYVDELPKSCENCPFYKLDTYIDINYVTINSHECVLEGSILTGDCPLKPLSDRLAEERKNVCDAVYKLTRELMSFGYDTVGLKDVEKVLEQFDRGE